MILNRIGWSWQRVKYRICLFFFKDVIQDELTQALHPEFGWFWDETHTGGMIMAENEYMRSMFRNIEIIALGGQSFEIGEIKKRSAALVQSSEVPEPGDDAYRTYSIFRIIEIVARLGSVNGGGTKTTK